MITANLLCLKFTKPLKICDHGEGGFAERMMVESFLLQLFAMNCEMCIKHPTDIPL